MPEVLAQATALLEKTGFTPDRTSCRLLDGGRNNRVYRLDTSDGPVLLKKYHGDDWNRMAAESRFLRFCDQGTIGRVPRLLGEDEANGLALHSWLDGERLKPAEMGAGDVDEAAGFLRDLVGGGRAAEIADIRPARDACLSLEDFFRSPRRRLTELKDALDAAPDMPSSAEAACFLKQQLLPAWEGAGNEVCDRLGRNGTSCFFPTDTPIVSPSDFGFHNSLRLRDGSGLAFVDFEYAGKDDPAKALGDFLCQVEYSPPTGTLEKLAAAVCESGQMARELAGRVEILLPLFRIKFCCIILNEFKTIDAARRNFALVGNIEQRRSTQLTKAKAYADRFLSQFDRNGNGQ